MEEFVEIIKWMPIIHCARGASRCDKCKKAIQEGLKISLVKVYLKPGYIARPMTDIDINGKKSICEYDIVTRFKDEKEAKDYARKHNVKIAL